MSAEVPPSLFRSIVLPLDGSPAAAAGIGCAVWLAGRLGACIHIVAALPQSLPARDALAHLKVPEAAWPQVELHQAQTSAEEAILEAARRHDAPLVVIAARGETASTEGGDTALGPLVGHVTRAVIEQCAAPVLVLPPAYRERLPWQRALVPVSGEAETDAALALAVRLANALDLRVHVAHVADGDDREDGIAVISRYADALHHEYPSRLEALVRHAVPQCTPEECACIDSVALGRGDVASELLRLVEERGIGLLVVGWHGRFVTGRARALKRLAERITCPVLLVKAVERMPFRLKVGEEIE